MGEAGLEAQAIRMLIGREGARLRSEGVVDPEYHAAEQVVRWWMSRQEWLPLVGYTEARAWRGR